MKRLVGIFLSCCLLLGLCGCGGDVSDVTIEPYHSDIYTNTDMRSAIDAVKLSFYFLFPSCTMTEITYAGDDPSQREAAGRDLPPDEELIVLLSTFDVAESGADGGLVPGKTYHDFKWILIRRNGGLWSLLSYGYA